MFEASPPIRAPESPARRLARALRGEPAVRSTDAIPADVDPRDETVVEIVLRAGYDHLPATVADVIYAFDFAPASVEPRGPEHHYVLAVER